MAELQRLAIFKWRHFSPEAAEMVVHKSPRLNRDWLIAGAILHVVVRKKDAPGGFLKYWAHAATLSSRHSWMQTSKNGFG